MPSGRTDVTDIVLKRGTAARWTAVNPVLKQAEPGVETDTLKLKIGDGSTAWNSLPYTGGSITLTTTGTSGVATLIGSVLNVPNYAAGLGGISRSVTVVSTNTSAGSASNTDYVYVCSSTMTLTLPTAVGNTNRYTVKNGGLATVTVATTSAQTIDGSTTAALTPNTALDLISDGSNWRVI
jgi:hypothetical protein